MAFQNSTGVNVERSTFYDVGRDHITNNFNHSHIPDLKTLLDPVPDASYNRGGCIARCLQGTREGIIAKIVQWWDEGSDRPICWLNGPAGFGKSAVAQTIAELCAASNRLAASFFFFRGAGHRSTIARFFATLAYQLAYSLPGTKTYIHSVLENDPLIVHRSLEHQFNKLVIDPILALTRTGIIPSMVIIVDALDECNDKDSIADFIEILALAFRDRRLPIRFFFTSRVEEHIRKKFEAPAAHSTTYFLALQDFDAGDDIRTFFQSRFSTIRYENRRLMRNLPQPWPSNSDLKELVQKSSGSFIFAFTLVNFVNDGTDLPHRKLQIALRSHAGLDPLYTQVFSSAPCSRHFERVISTIVLLSSPLPITDLGCLLQLENADILHALLGIQSILMIPEEDYNQPVQLFHTLLRDFLTMETRSRDLFIDPPTHHIIITTDCLKVMMIHPQDGIFYGGAQKYACDNWCYHFYNCLTEGGHNLLDSLSGTSLMSCLMDFVNQSVDSWVNTLILGRQVQDILKVLHRVISRLKVGPVFICSRIWNDLTAFS